MADWEQLRELTQQVAPPDFASLERTARHRQRRARAVVGMAAALVLVGGGLGIAALDDDAGRAPLQPAEDPTASITDAPDDVLRLPALAEGESAVDLAGGRYRIPLTSDLSFDIDLPGPTTAHDDGLFLATERYVVKTEAAFEAYGVPRHPCTDHMIEPVGPTVDDLVQAIGRLPVYEVSRPEPVELGGGEGFYVEARIPRSYDASKCERDTVRLPGNPSSAVGGPPPYVGRWWVLDVDGQRVVIQQNCWGCGPHPYDGGPQTVESITFTSTAPTS